MENKLKQPVIQSLDDYIAIKNVQSLLLDLLPAYAQINIHTQVITHLQESKNKYREMMGAETVNPADENALYQLITEAKIKASDYRNEVYEAELKIERLIRELSAYGNNLPAVKTYVDDITRCIIEAKQDIANGDNHLIAMRDYIRNMDEYIAQYEKGRA